MKAPRYHLILHSIVPAIRIAIIYAVVASVWIFASDRLLGLLVQDPRLLTQFATYKGLGFVAITALMLYGLVQHALSSQPEGAPSPSKQQDAPTPRLTWPILAFVVLTAIIVGVGRLAVQFQKKTLRQEEQSRLFTVAQFKAKQLDAWVDMGKRQLDYACSRSLLARTSEQWFSQAPASGELGVRLQGRIRDFMQAGHCYFVTLRDSRGKSQLRAGNFGEGAHSVQDALLAMETLQTQVRAEYRPGAAPLVHLFTPLTVEARGRLNSVGCMHVALDADRELIPELESDLREPVLPAKVLVVGFRDGHAAFLNPHLREAAPQAHLDILAHLAPERGAESLQTSKTLGAVAWSTALPWGVIATEDADIIFQATQRMANLVVLLGAVFLATGAALIAFWMRLQHRLYTQHQQRQALENQILEKRLDYLSRFANDIVLLLDSDGRILDANDRACTAYGYAREELLTLTIKELRDPESLTEFPHQWRKARDTGASIFESRHCRRDGTTFPVEVSSRQVELQDRSLVQSIVRDISERKAAENELRRINRLQTLILENSAVGIGLVRNNVYEWVNPRLAEMLGGQASQIQGTPPRTYVDNATDREIVAKLADGFAKGEWTSIECTFNRLDGSPFWGRMLVKALDPTKPAEGAINIFEDITERKESEEALRQAQKLESLGVLAGGIAHDFNNLLTAILGNLNLAQHEIGGQHPAHGYLDNVEKTILKATDLTRQMLAYSGKGRFIVKSNNLNQIISEMAELLKVSIPKKIELVLELASGLPGTVSDAAQIQQVVMNLVTNAADAIGDRVGTIAIRSSSERVGNNQVPSAHPGKFLPPGPYIRLEVEDDGCGMTPEVVAKIFDPFFSTKMTGRGLGLSAMLGILRGHNAGLQIHSQPGKGSRFELFFPVATTLANEATPEAQASPLPAQGTRILLVDDEPMIREMAGFVLNALGMEVTLGADGEEAMKIFQSQDIDLVVLDLTMPRMDGREAFRRLRELRPGLPIIVCSGYSEQEALLDAHGQPPTAFLPKPYAIKTLERVVGEVLASKRS